MTTKPADPAASNPVIARALAELKVAQAILDGLRIQRADDATLTQALAKVRKLERRISAAMAHTSGPAQEYITRPDRGLVRDHGDGGDT